MIKKVYCLYDVAAVESSTPDLIKNEALALRYFENSTKELPHAGDYKLFYLGEYNTETMEYELCEKPEEVVPNLKNVLSETDVIPSNMRGKE